MAADITGLSAVRGNRSANWAGTKDDETGRLPDQFAAAIN